MRDSRRKRRRKRRGEKGVWCGILVREGEESLSSEEDKEDDSSDEFIVSPSIEVPK